MTIRNSAIISNTGERGGGIYNSSGQATVINSTVSGNIATDAVGGGGIYINSSGSTVTLINSTVVSNTAPAATNRDGLYLGGGTVTLNGTIVA
jgi:hypothetical protein